MNQQTPKRSIAVTALLLVLAALLWGSLLAVLVVVVPGYERAFRAQDMALPAPTLWALAAGRWAANYWYVVPLFALLLLPFLLPLCALPLQPYPWPMPRSQPLSLDLTTPPVRR